MITIRSSDFATLFSTQSQLIEVWIILALRGLLLGDRAGPGCISRRSVYVQTDHNEHQNEAAESHKSAVANDVAQLTGKSV